MEKTADAELLKKRIRELEYENGILKFEQQNFRHLKRVSEVLGEINRQAQYASEPDEIAEKACTLLMSCREYSGARIVLLNKDGGVISGFGAGGSFGEKSSSFKTESIGARCRAAGEGREVLIVKSPDAGCGECSQRVFCGGDSIMTAAIAHGKRIFGFLSVSVQPYYYLNDDESSLFFKLACDIGFALAGLDVRKKNRRYEYIIENLPITFSVLSTDYTYLYVNNRYTTLFNLPVSRVVGRNAEEFFEDEEYRNRILPMLDKCLEGSPVDYILEVSFDTIGTRWMHMYYYPYFSADGRVSRIISHGIDVTDHKETENLYNKSETRFKNIINTAVDIIMIISEDGGIIGINDSACEKHGRTREEILSGTVELLDPNYPPEKFREFWNTVPVNKPMTFESTHRTMSGSEFPVEIVGKKIELDGAPVIISIVRDISRRKTDNKRLIAALRRAEEADRLKSAFLANMSHEIRTPLNGILGFSALLKEPGITPEQQQEYYSIIEKSGERLLSTINDLIDISRVAAGMAETELKPAGLGELFRELYDFFKPEFTRKKLTLGMEMYPDDSVEMITDREKLYAIMTNLLKNAVKFTPSGRIVFGYTAGRHFIEFYVKDSGIGIAPDKLNIIFDRFVQADHSFTKQFEGSGLGLAICREYAGMLGGTIRAESTPGKGSAFFVRLPLLKKGGTL